MEDILKEIEIGDEDRIRSSFKVFNEKVILYKIFHIIIIIFILQNNLLILLMCVKGNCLGRNCSFDC